MTKIKLSVLSVAAASFVFVSATGQASQTDPAGAQQVVVRDLDAPAQSVGLAGDRGPNDALRPCREWRRFTPPRFRRVPRQGRPGDHDRDRGRNDDSNDDPNDDHNGDRNDSPDHD